MLRMVFRPAVKWNFELDAILYAMCVSRPLMHSIIIHPFIHPIFGSLCLFVCLFVLSVLSNSMLRVGIQFHMHFGSQWRIMHKWLCEYYADYGHSTLTDRTSERSVLTIYILICVYESLMPCPIHLFPFINFLDYFDDERWESDQFLILDESHF